MNNLSVFLISLGILELLGITCHYLCVYYLVLLVLFVVACLVLLHVCGYFSSSCLCVFGPWFGLFLLVTIALAAAFAISSYFVFNHKRLAKFTDATL